MNHNRDELKKGHRAHLRLSDVCVDHRTLQTKLPASSVLPVPVHFATCGYGHKGRVMSTWLFRVAQNAAIDQIRRRRLKVVSLRQEDGEGEARDWDLPSPERGPYGELRNQERGGAIQEAIEALPWEYRELILLRHFGELPYEEIARMKQMPLGTVKNKLFRGRQMLKDKLKDYLCD